MEDESFGGLDDNVFASYCQPPVLDFPHKSWEQFTENLTVACQPYFPQSIPEHHAVHVLLLNWEADDIGTLKELKELRELFEKRFAYSTEIWPIPSFRPESALENKLGAVKQLHGNEGCLIIVYYGGHGEMKRDGRSVWAANLGPRSPKLEWSSLQPTLKRAECDVLILLDCCFASSAVRGEINGINEIIAACGRESETVARGKKTFTQNLIRKIKSFGDQPFAAIEIYKRMIKDRKRLLASPHYDNLSGWKKPSIILVPRKLSRSSGNISASSADSTISNSSASSRLSPGTSETSISGITEALDGPRVLLALSLAADANVPELEAWIQWLTSGAPPEIRNLEVKYESIYHGHSTLLLVSMPVTAWTRLPPSSGFRFIDVVTSDNLIPQAMADRAKADIVVDQHDAAKLIKAGLIKNPTGSQAQMLETNDDILGATTFGSKLSLSQFNTLKDQSGMVQTAALRPDKMKIASALKYEEALRVASYEGHDRLVQILIEHGVDINAEGGRYGNALQAAAYKGHAKVVQLLVEHGVDINAGGGRYGNALQAAAYKGHDKVVQILVDRGADVNAQGVIYGNALCAASLRGHDKVVQILLECGVDVNAQGGFYDNALYAASCGGHDKVVQLLVEHGVHLSEEDYDSAYQAASSEGHGKVLQMLSGHRTKIRSREK